MSSKSKLTLLIELKNKLFNNKLVETQRKFTKIKDKMMGIHRLVFFHILLFIFILFLYHISNIEFIRLIK